MLSRSYKSVMYTQQLVLSRVEVTDQCFSHADLVAQGRLQAARHDNQLLKRQLKAEAGI